MNMKRCWEKINLISNDNFKLPDLFFKVIIALSLPSSWDAFTNPFVGGVRGEEEKDPKKLMSSQEFIGILKEESTWCQGCAQMESTNQVFSNKSNLIKRLGVSSAKGKCALLPLSACSVVTADGITITPPNAIILVQTSAISVDISVTLASIAGGGAIMVPILAARSGRWNRHRCRLRIRMQRSKSKNKLMLLLKNVRPRTTS